MITNNFIVWVIYFLIQKFISCFNTFIFENISFLSHDLKSFISIDLKGWDLKSHNIRISAHQTCIKCKSALKVIAWEILRVFKNNNLVETKHFITLNRRGCLLRLKCISKVNSTILINSNCKTNKLNSNSDMFLEIWIIKSNIERNCLQTKYRLLHLLWKFIGPSSEQRKIIYWRVLFKRLQNFPKTNSLTFL